ncbi:hypothetical protein N5923_19095 [Erwiniaceae bacterium BAC15a-03b]|uniref:Uncharacterized protein n=1 Tax=Winslowiella arboricola TaxID=2978220 RepID=A0A9J6PXN7_9GAMM|nr:hypothetical protein [Winslowiella arboricola]MCU5775554.1 hypothetical protein [Winslowiella arboricola]MCU5779596.1 hypothetical protein [Winslowiella arboricola]
MNIGTASKNSLSIPEGYSKEIYKRFPDIAKVSNTPHVLAGMPGQSYKREPLSQTEQIRSLTVKKIKFLIEDYPPYCKHKLWREMQEASLNQVAEVILTEKVIAGGFSPDFSLEDVANKKAFIDAMDREYKKHTFSNGVWIKKLKESLDCTGMNLKEENNNYNVLRAFVAECPLSRIRLAINCLEFSIKIRNMVPDTSHQIKPVVQQSANKLRRRQNPADAAQSRLELQSKYAGHREIMVKETFKKIKSDLLEQIDMGYNVNMEYVYTLLEKTNNLDGAEKADLERKLTIIVCTEEAFNDVIARKVNKDTARLSTMALITAEVDITKVLTHEKVKALQLTREEEREQCSRLEARKQKIYHEDHGNSVFYRQ